MYANKFTVVDLKIKSGNIRRHFEGDLGLKFWPCNKFFIDQACSFKMAGYWSHSFFVFLWTSTSSWSIKMQKKKKIITWQISSHLAFFLSHAWSIAHIYCFCFLVHADEDTRQR